MYLCHGHGLKDGARIETLDSVKSMHAVYRITSTSYPSNCFITINE